MSVEFTCNMCGSDDIYKNTVFEDFYASAYSDSVVLWSQVEDKIPELNKNDFWLRSEHAPSIGDSWAVSVCYPFNQDAGAEFWTLYVPAGSSLNGWAEHPEEIDLSAFVKCKVVKILRERDHQAWVQVHVTDRVMLSEATERVPVVEEVSPLLGKLYTFDHTNVLNFGGWQLCQGDGQGDLGNWLLLKEIDNKPHIIAMGEWGFHQQVAYLGNVRLTDKTYNEIQSRYVAVSTRSS